jgi:hypothetical protein
MGTYLAHGRGTLSPAFVVEDLELSRILSAHFECVWEKSGEHVVYRVTREEIVDGLAVAFRSVKT